MKTLMEADYRLDAPHFCSLIKKQRLVSSSPADEGRWPHRKSPIMLEWLHNFFYSILLHIYQQTEAHSATTQVPHNKGSLGHKGRRGKLLFQPARTKPDILMEQLRL